MRYLLVFIIVLGVVILIFSLSRFSKGPGYTFESGKEKQAKTVVMPDMVKIRKEDRSPKNAVVIERGRAAYEILEEQRPPDIMKIEPSKEGWDYVK